MTDHGVLVRDAWMRAGAEGGRLLFCGDLRLDDLRGKGHFHQVLVGDLGNVLPSFALAKVDDLFVEVRPTGVGIEGLGLRPSSRKSLSSLAHALVQVIERHSRCEAMSWLDIILGDIDDFDLLIEVDLESLALRRLRGRRGR